MGSGLAGPLLFWEGGGMSEVRRFEMLKVARTVARSRDWIFAIFLAFGWSDLSRVFGDGSIELMHVLGLLRTWLSLSCALLGVWSVGVIYRWGANRRPAKFLEMTEDMVRGPLGWRNWVEIPRSQVEEVVATTEGLIIAWKKDGVPWCTEVMEMSFSEEEWGRVRGALMEWGNRAGEG